MRNRTGSLAIGVVFVAGVSALAAELPVAVSPGRVGAGAVVESRCPTFSWGSVDGATRYELVVVEVGEEEAGAETVLEQEIPGSASSWTPSLEACLERGRRYAWSVRGVGGGGVSDWSVPSLFEVSAGPGEVELERAFARLRAELLERVEAGSAPERVAVPGGGARSHPEGPAPAAPAVTEVAVLQGSGAINVSTSRHYSRRVAFIGSTELLRVAASADDTHVSVRVEVFGAQQDGSEQGFSTIIATAIYDLAMAGFVTVTTLLTDFSPTPPQASVTGGTELVIAGNTDGNQDLLTAWIEVFSNKEVTFTESF